MSNLIAVRKTGRCATGHEKGKGTLWHALSLSDQEQSTDMTKYFSTTFDQRPALCGTAPGDRSLGWSSNVQEQHEVNCSRCLKAIEKLTEEEDANYGDKMVYDKELDDELKRLGKSQISYALMRNKMNEVDALIKEGHNFNPKEEPYLLAKATNDQHTEGVLKLLQNGYDPNYQDEAGRAALHDVKDVPTAMVLLEHGANPNIKDAYGNNPLHRDMGALGGDVAMTLIEAGADVLATNVVGWSPLEMVRRWSDAVESASLVTVLETQTIKAVINNALSDVGPNEWKKEADADREKRQERMHQDQGFVEAEHREERRTTRRRM